MDSENRLYSASLGRYTEVTPDRNWFYIAAACILAVAGHGFSRIFVSGKVVILYMAVCGSGVTITVEAGYMLVC